MVKERTERAKRRILSQVRKQRLKYITILPSLITLLNGICGFAAIVFASKMDSSQGNEFSFNNYQMTPFAASCYMIFFAMIADMLDGHIARISQSTSSFGGQLDSLCDVISFGPAPAFLMLKVLEYKLGGLDPFAGLLGRFIWLTAAIYIGCGAIRLARFNVENEEDEAAHMSFSGLPIPAAAGVVASLVLLDQHLLETLQTKSSWLGTGVHNVIVFSLPFVVLGVAVLMIGRIRYPHIVNQYLRGRKPFAYLIGTIAFLFLSIFIREIAMVVLFCTFALSGPFKWFHYKVVAKKRLSTSSHSTITTGNS